MLWALPIIALATATGAAAQERTDAASQQWFTGSLYAVSPALSRAGAIAIEPYAIYSRNTGRFDAEGRHQARSDGTDQAIFLTVVKYGLTDRLTIATTPAFTHSWNDVARSTGSGFGDLPVELEYRLQDGIIATGAPSITASIGVRLPTGAHDRLRNALNGSGSGAWSARAGLLAQSLFNTGNSHAMRVRLYGSVSMPVASVSVHDASVYGTEAGFAGRVLPGASAEAGMSVGYGFNQRWVLALDLLYDTAQGFALDGTRADGSRSQTRSPTSSSFAIAPAIEYSWSADAGIIVGVALSAAGRNSASFIAPQIAISLSF
jgi:hypothetical protein